ncbi:MAG: alpha/beta fold hydrolase [Gammaproteobacteria bacterium]
MPRTKLTFPNRQGQQLAGLLESPDGEARVYALFAHCFTCSKDIAAASRITRALTRRGIAVLRFDFTGLGNSDGDFSNTNFSSNLQDLIAASEYLQQHYIGPGMLIGHSLGGAAVLAAAHEIESVKAVVTIGAPATADHIGHMFVKERDRILSEEQANVDLGGRRFTIKKQFLKDIDNYNSVEHIAKLNRALLVFHSPVDRIVSVEEAARIYQAAKHPKSFVSLDKADHLLSRREDSEYVAAVMASWAGRYLDLHEVEEERSSGTAPSIASGHVLVDEQDRKFTRSIYTGNHQLIADEPMSSGGADLGPNPYEYLLTALGACTSMTVRMYANRKQINLENIKVRLDHSRIHADDCEECESKQGFVDKISKVISLEGDMTDEQRQRLMEIADSCPVHKTLHNEILITSRQE